MTKIIDLAQFKPKLPSVDLGDHGVHQVAAVTGHVMQHVHAAARGGDEAAQLWEAAVRLLPTVPRDVVLALSINEVQEIIAIATGDGGGSP